MTYLFRPPRQIISDEAMEFSSAIIQAICRATGMEETPKAALDIHCLRRGGGVALTSTTNKFLHREVMAAHRL